MPELRWVGKDKVITHHLDVPLRVLERQYSFGQAGQSRGPLAQHGDPWRQPQSP